MELKGQTSSTIAKLNLSSDRPGKLTRATRARGRKDTGAQVTVCKSLTHRLEEPGDFHGYPRSHPFRVRLWHWPPVYLSLKGDWSLFLLFGCFFFFFYGSSSFSERFTAEIRSFVHSASCVTVKTRWSPQKIESSHRLQKGVFVQCGLLCH